MKRNFVVGILGGLIGSAMLLIVLSATGIVGARDANVARPDVSHANDVSAATPLTSTFTYQGQLKNGGTAMNGSCAIAFRLYDDPLAGNLIGSPITPTVPVTNGLFTVGLNFGSNAFNGNNRWLDIKVNCGSGFVALTPRQAVTAAPYALYAKGNWALTGNSTTTSANFLGTTDAQALVFKTNNTEHMRVATNGNVGIGTTNPAQALHISGPNSRLRLESTQSDDWTVTEYKTDNREWHTGVGGSAVPGDLQDKYYIYDGTAFENRLVIDTLGRVSIGTSSPVAKLDVRASFGGLSIGVYGDSAFSGYGVWGNSPSGYGVYGESISGNGVAGYSTSGNAGWFSGPVQVNGAMTVTGYLAKQGGGFLIDHPLNPANQYLNHSFVESPDMKDVYDGNVTLDANGEATVILPDYFEALNRDFRYQLTALGAPGPNLYIAAEVKNNRFKIAGGTAGGKVSWQVTGIRHDPWAEQNRRPATMDKTGQERGKYMYPQGYGQPDSLRIGYEQRPVLDRLAP